MEHIDVLVTPVEMSTLNTDLRERPEFYDGYKCPVTSCDDRRYQRYQQYMRHWRNFHVSNISMFHCIACTSTFRNKLDLREHLISRHRYERHFARNSTVNLQKVKVPNINYLTPKDVRPPVNVRTEVTEEIIVVEEGDMISRDMDLQMIERDGKLTFVAFPKKDF